MIKYYTCQYDPSDFKFVQRYFTNRTNYPKYGKLFAFNSLVSAQTYKDSFTYGENLVIAKATTTKITTPQELGTRNIPYYSEQTKGIANFWSNPKQCFSFNTIPDNTVFCDDLTIQEILN
jgi:hypothetical protein